MGLWDEDAAAWSRLCVWSVARPAAPSAPHPSLPAQLSLLCSVVFIPGSQTQPTGLPTSRNPGAAAWHPARSVPTPGCSGRCRLSPVTPPSLCLWTRDSVASCCQ